MRRRIRVFGETLSSVRLIHVGLLVLVALAICPFAASQVTVFNPGGLTVPEGRAQLLLRLSCNSAAEQLHAEHAQTEFPLTLVMGKNPGLYTMDDTHQIYTVYLQEWNESDFTKATYMIAMRRLLVLRSQKAITEILRHAHSIAPVGIEELRSGKLKQGHRQP
jgi:hypothetical protein